MKKFYLLVSVMILFIVACGNDEDESKINTDDFSGTEITYSGDVQGVAVLIFGLSNNQYIYQRALTGTWIDRHQSTNLNIGNYKFLYYRAPQNIMSPASLAGKQLEDIRFVATADAVKGDPYLEPVPEVWLPETPAMANQIHTIVGDGRDSIKNTLKRAHTQVELNIRRGKLEDCQFTAIPYETGESIMDEIAEIKMDIAGVGEYVDYAGSYGNKRTYYATTAPQIDGDGFAYVEGPLVFPNSAQVEEATVNIELIPKSGSILEGNDNTVTVTGKLERNRKLVINLWFTTTYKYIEVDVVTTEITAEDDGDTGIWE